MSIGAVLDQLRPDFPEVTISKIRFLEAEGLIRPARTESGYRQFAQGDVERLRYVLRVQRDHYLPLKVIKEHLDTGTRSRGPVGDAPVFGRPSIGAAAGAGDEPALPGGDGRDLSGAALSEADFLASTGLSRARLAELVQYGLLKPDADGGYAPASVEVARTAAAMMSFGIEPRHLRAFRTAADREVGLLAQLVVPVARQRDTGARERAVALSAELSALSVALHTLLVKVGLQDAIRG